MPLSALGGLARREGGPRHEPADPSHLIQRAHAMEEVKRRLLRRRVASGGIAKCLGSNLHRPHGVNGKDNQSDSPNRAQLRTTRLVHRPLLSLVPGLHVLMFPKEDRSQSLIRPVPYGACVHVRQ